MTRRKSTVKATLAILAASLFAGGLMIGLSLRSQNQISALPTPNEATETATVLLRESDIDTAVVQTATSLAETLQFIVTRQGLPTRNPSYTPRAVILSTLTPSRKPPFAPDTSTPSSGVPSIRPPRLSVGDIASGDDRICVTMFPGDFWEPGDEADSLAGRLTYDSRIIIDNELEISREVRSRSGSDSFMPEFDSRGNYVGSYGGILYVCFETYGVEAGEHTATIEVTTRSGFTYTYSWRFELLERVPSSSTPSSDS